LTWNERAYATFLDWRIGPTPLTAKVANNVKSRIEINNRTRGGRKMKDKAIASRFKGDGGNPIMAKKMLDPPNREMKITL